jgi:hypothetical protein
MPIIVDMVNSKKFFMITSFIMRKVLNPRFIALIILLVGVYGVGCTGPRQIVVPDAKEVFMAKAVQIEREGLKLQATVLDENQEKRLLAVNVGKRNVVPVLFVMSNQTEIPYRIRREHFALGIDQFRIEPALPGRAAVLLQDTSRSKGTAWAGLAVFGILAAPSIVAAERKEAASVESHREIIFSEVSLPPGGTIAGYLFFESPVPLRKVQKLELELRITGNNDKLIPIQLANPYATLKGKTTK